MFDKIMLDYIHRRGWKINDDGLLVLTAAQAKECTGRSIRDPQRRSLMIPGLHGCALIFEGRHFIVSGEVRK